MRWNTRLMFPLFALIVSAQEPTTCPGFVPAGVTCHTGAGAYGSPYLIAIPERWNGTLILSNPGLTPVPFTEPRSIGPAVLLLPEGYAIATSSYHRGIAREAARDTEDLRQIFIRRFGRPSRTVADGSSFGGLVTARLIELYGRSSDGRPNYDGATPRCGMVGGTLKFTQLHVDLRTVYQYYCGNHPRSDEPQYELWQGLPPGAPLSVQDLTNRVNECTAISSPPAQRTEPQRQKLANILSVMRIAENALLNLMRAATFTQADIVQNYLGGRNPASNHGVTYRGSVDDEALNRGVARYASDPSAVAALSEADDPTGAVSIPTLSMHAMDDRERFVEQEADYKEVFAKAGSGKWLTQIFTTGGEHCLFTPPESVAQLRGLLGWLETGSKPGPEEFAGLCDRASADFPGACRFDPAYQPNALATVTYPRQPAPRCGLSASPKVQAVVNSASFQPGLGINSMITVIGSGLTSDQIRREILPLDLLNGSFPLELACVGLSLGGVRAPVTFVSGNRIDAQAPTFPFTDPVKLEVIAYPGRGNESRADLSGILVGQYAPAFFLDGRRIAAHHADGAQVSEKRPARPGDVVRLYGTGFGVTEPVYQAGEIVRERAPLRDAVSVTIGGTALAASHVLYAGLLPGWISGLYEFELRLPDSVSGGDVPVTVRIGGLATQTDATLLVQR